MISVNGREVRYAKRPQRVSGAEDEVVRTTVQAVIDDVHRGGVEAVKRYSHDYDNWVPESFEVDHRTIEAAIGQVDPAQLREIDAALERIRAFANFQLGCLLPLDIEIAPGIRIGHRNVPVNVVGAYVPGGRYPLIASALMTVAVAKVAGVGRVVACAPPGRNGSGIDPLQLVAISRAGADCIFCVGGIQALAAMAFGPGEFAPGVDLLIGAGNAWVAEAKRQLFGVCGIDLLAGPTELLVVADRTASPGLIAADLLGQAEHGPTSEVTLVTTSRKLASAVIDEVEGLLKTWPTREVASQAWRDFGSVIITTSRDEAIRVADQIAAEHVEIQAEIPDWYAERLTNYGTLFIGEDATVVYSDKSIGTNHVLPTRRAARYTGGLWVGSFLRTLTYQRITSVDGTRIVAPNAAAIAEAEGMFGHAITARIRLERADGTTARIETP